MALRTKVHYRNNLLLYPGKYFAIALNSTEVEVNLHNP